MKSGTEELAEPAAHAPGTVPSAAGSAGAAASEKESRLWIVILSVGTVLCVAGYGLEHVLGSSWIVPALLAVGGLAVIDGSCEAMIKAVEGLGERLGWSEYVAGTIAGLASNVPELVMLGFVVAADPRVAFVVIALTLHVNALAFGLYSGLLPHDESGRARLPEALVKISTDLFSIGAGFLVALGSLMVVMSLFRTGDQHGVGLGAVDLLIIGLCLLVVQGVTVRELVARFGGKKSPVRPVESGESKAAAEKFASPRKHAPTWTVIVVLALVGIGMSLLGGDAVGDFADVLVGGLRHAGYSEMFGAMILSVFSGTGGFVMMISAHRKKMYDIALAGASGNVTQVVFLVLPTMMVLMAVLAWMGVIPTLAHGAVLPIDLETTSVVFLGFPTLLLLGKNVQDDGNVSWLETSGMVALFGLIIYFLAQHG